MEAEKRRQKALKRISESCLTDFDSAINWAQWCRALACDALIPGANDERELRREGIVSRRDQRKEREK